MTLKRPFVPTLDQRRWFTVARGLPVTRIAFDVVDRHRARIEDNQGHTLEELSAGGGLDFYELWCGFHDVPLFPAPRRSERQMRDDVLDEVMRLAAPIPGNPYPRQLP